MSRRQREQEMVAKEVKNERASGGGRRKVGKGEERVMNGRITKKKSFAAKESGEPRAKDKKVFVVEIVKAEGGEGKENISAVVLTAKTDDEEPSALVEAPVVKKKPNATRKALAEGKGKEVDAVEPPNGEVLKTDAVIDGRASRPQTLPKPKTAPRTV